MIFSIGFGKNKTNIDVYIAKSVNELVYSTGSTTLPRQG